MRSSSAVNPDPLAFVDDELHELDERSLRRRLRVAGAVRSATIAIDGKERINFSSNNYLNFAGAPRLQNAVRRAMTSWGAGATSSRLISGTSELHESLERALASWMNAEAALVFPSGYMANLGLIAALAEPGDAIIADRLCHASIIDAARLSGARLFVYRHADANDARQALARAGSYRRRLLVSDSLFSMDGDFAPVDELPRAAREFGAISILDEAHALGVWGPSGDGRAAALQSPWDIRIGTLSKSFGSQGGFVAGPRGMIDLLVNKARTFIYTTGLSPLCVAAAREALTWIQDDPAPREKVIRLAAQLRNGLLDAGFDICGSQSHVVPILLGSAERALSVAQSLWDDGFYAPAIRPPTVRAGRCRIRFSVTAAHEAKDIDRLLETLRKRRA